MFKSNGDGNQNVWIRGGEVAIREVHLQADDQVEGIAPAATNSLQTSLGDLDGKRPNLISGRATRRIKELEMELRLAEERITFLEAGDDSTNTVRLTCWLGKRSDNRLV